MKKYSDTTAAAHRWEALRTAINNDSLYSAIRDFYSLYDSGLAVWLAGLYDPAIGGFYYSASARDNEYVELDGVRTRLLPDAESTLQALGIISASGMAEDSNNSWVGFIPEWMKKSIGDFAYSLQDPDGFFYHPQWGKNIGLSRRGRDFSWCRGILSALGREMKYPTVIDKKNEKTAEVFIPDHLSSRGKFLDYLDSLDVSNKSYPAGNTLSAQSIQIKGAGLMDVCIAYLSERQNSETGLWHSDQSYYGVNGLMKISGVYNSAGVSMPHAKEAAGSAIAAIASTEPIRAVVDLWNTWVACERICENLRRFGAEEGRREADLITKELREIASGAVRSSLEKLTPFRKELSSFSYLRDGTVGLSQGAPVAIPGSVEGDVNATMIAGTHMVGAIFTSLGLGEYAVPIFGREEGRIFLDIVTEKWHKCKV